jgi:hypothetical protein
MASSTGRARRVGYLVAAGINVVLLLLVNVRPGWEVVPFLTPETANVIGLVNLSLILGILTNVVYSVRDPSWLKALGSVVTTAVALAVTARTLQVFPFDFGDSGVDWPLWARLGLWFCIVVLSIALFAQAATFLKALVGSQQDGSR